MTGRRMLHAHMLVKQYAAEQVPTQMFAAKADGIGRDYLPLPVPANPNLMKMVLDYPVYYWSLEALVKASTWTFAPNPEELKEHFKRILKVPGAIHFFDTPQKVHNAAHGLIDCIGMIRYDKHMIAMLYVHEGCFNWDNLSDKYMNFNIYFVNGSTFAEFHQTMLIMWEGWANLPVEANVKTFDKNPNMMRGIDQKTRKSYHKNPVRVVTLQKVIKSVDGAVITAKRIAMEQSLGAAGKSHVINVQFDVRGHTRNQWYPSEGKHRVIWVEPFIKGKDKPRKEEQAVVHKVIDRGG